MLVVLLLFWADPASFDALFRSGLTALNQNHLDAAQGQLEGASRLQPANPQVWVALAQTYRKLKREPAAQSAAEKAEALAGNNALALHELAYFHTEAGAFGKAALLESRYAQLTPSDDGAVSRAAGLYLQAHQPDQAIELTARALRKTDRADLRFLLGKAYALERQPAKAAEQMRRAANLNPYQEDYYFEAARQYSEAGNSPAAIEVIQAGKKVFARSPQLELMLGVAYYAIQQYQQAVDAFLRTIQLDPAVEQSYVFIARSMNHTPSRLPEILRAFQALAQKTPDSYMSSYLYGRALREQGDHDRQAETLLRKSVSLNDHYWESHLELGETLEQEGELEEAGRELRKSLELNPKSATAHFRLGRVYDQLGKPEKAKEEYAMQGRLIDQDEAAPQPLSAPQF